MAVSTSPQLAPHEEGGSACDSGAIKIPHLNARVLTPLVRYLRERVDPHTLARASASAGFDLSTFEGGPRWITVRRAESLLRLARDFVTDDDSFRDACAYKLGDGYGALRLVLWATSPRAVYEHAVDTQHLVCNYGTSELVTSSRTGSVIRYRATTHESRLMCLSRQAALTALPTLFGLPRAYLREDVCIGRGAPHCEYHLRWHDQRRWFPTAIGGLAGGAALGGLTALTGGIDLASLALPLLCAAVGYIVETRRITTANLSVRDEVGAALREFARGETEARQELLELQERQRDWLRRVEQELDARSAALAEMSGVGEKRLQVLRGQVHDLRTMLTVVPYALEASETNSRSEEESAAVDDGREALAKIDRILRQAMQQWERGRALVALEPRRVEVEQFSAGLQRRLGALAHGTQLRVAVHTTREAPSSIVTDPLLVDRVLDNLLGNAVKYTARGSVNVEVGGAPGFLTVKIADTGPGIGSERFNRVFRPGGSLVDERVDGFGVGLSIVVQLLAQIGGRLEVMSTPPDGTTFWVFIPIELAPPATPRLQETNADGDADRLFEQVVRVHGAN